MNVLEYGLGDTGSTLAARYPDPLGVAVFVLTNEPGPFARIWYIPPNTALDPAYFPFTLTKGSNRFPYGHPVDPDGPV